MENVVYLAMRNDLAYVFHDELFLYEQQSSKNGNMPLRCLFYVSDSYSENGQISEFVWFQDRSKFLRRSLLSFIMGKSKVEEKDLCFFRKPIQRRQKLQNLELRVRSLLGISIFGNSKEIYKKSRTMREYMIFVDKARRYSEGQPLDDAIERTVEECIRENVLRDFLLEINRR